MIEPVHIRRGNGPLILAIPHSGQYVPQDIFETLNPIGRQLADTDWHVDRLYDGLCPEATIIRAEFHRYVIDANRSPKDESLYPGQNTTGLCPATDFDGEPIYQGGQEPGAREIERRRRAFHEPYHRTLSEEISRVKERWGFAVLYDCHSIRSRAPFLFEGQLPDFNIGTNSGASCAPSIQSAAESVSARAHPYRSVTNGRFKGGWTTRYYGKPSENVHAIQMELAQTTYMKEHAPWTYNSAKAETLRKHLKDILGAVEAAAVTHFQTQGSLHDTPT